MKHFLKRLGCTFQKIVKGASNLKFILCIIRPILQKFYAQVCFRIFFLTCFLYINRKRIKWGHFLEIITQTVFNLRANFLSPVCLGHCFEYPHRRQFLIFDLFYSLFFNNIFKNIQKKYSFEAWVITKNIFKNRRVWADMRAKSKLRKKFWM